MSKYPNAAVASVIAPSNAPPAPPVAKLLHSEGDPDVPSTVTVNDPVPVLELASKNTSSADVGKNDAFGVPPVVSDQ
jgi:hypothetical protein